MGRRKRVTEFFKKKIARDVALVKSKAMAVIQVSDEGEIKVNWNKNPVLGVIAIIGSGKTGDCYFSEAILDEIGIGQSRPFHQSRIPFFCQKQGKSANIAKRYSGFCLSFEQYLKVAPVIFGLLQQITDLQVSRRECNMANPYCIYGSRGHYSRKGKKFLIFGKYIELLSGCRFAVSLSSQFLPDIFSAELNFNSRLREFLRGMANFIDLRLSLLKKSWRGYREFSRLKAVQQVVNLIQRKNLPFYLLAEILSLLPGGDKNKFFSHLAFLFCWDGEVTNERKISLLSSPFLQERINGLQLRIITGLGTNRDHIVFEVFPANHLPDTRFPKIKGFEKDEEILF